MAVYKREPCARSFDEDFVLHLLYGYVISTPEFFVMARPVVSIAPADIIVNPKERFHRHQCDTWHIYLLAGNMRAALAAMPFQLPKISFERDNELRTYIAKELQRRIRTQSKP